MQEMKKKKINFQTKLYMAYVATHHIHPVDL